MSLFKTFHRAVPLLLFLSIPTTTALNFIRTSRKQVPDDPSSLLVVEVKLLSLFLVCLSGLCCSYNLVSNQGGEDKENWKDKGGKTRRRLYYVPFD